MDYIWNSPIVWFIAVNCPRAFQCIHSKNDSSEKLNTQSPSELYAIPDSWWNSEIVSHLAGVSWSRGSPHEVIFDDFPTGYHTIPMYNRRYDVAQEKTPERSYRLFVVSFIHFAAVDTTNNHHLILHFVININTPLLPLTFPTTPSSLVFDYSLEYQSASHL